METGHSSAYSGPFSNAKMHCTSSLEHIETQLSKLSKCTNVLVYLYVKQEQKGFYTKNHASRVGEKPIERR